MSKSDLTIYAIISAVLLFAFWYGGTRYVTVVATYEVGGVGSFQNMADTPDTVYTVNGNTFIIHPGHSYPEIAVGAE